MSSSEMHSAGRVVILNGSPSAGKTTLAAKVIELSPEPWVLMAQDQFSATLLPDRISLPDSSAPRSGGFDFVRSPDGSLHVELGEIGRHLLSSYRQVVAARARGGDDVLVDEDMFDPGGWSEWQRNLRGLRTLWVRVHCELAECERRERVRDDRPELQGLARGHFELSHVDAIYNLIVDLTDGDVENAAETILGEASTMKSPSQ